MKKAHKISCKLQATRGGRTVRPVRTGQRTGTTGRTDRTTDKKLYGRRTDAVELRTPYGHRTGTVQHRTRYRTDTVPARRMYGAAAGSLGTKEPNWP